MPPPPPLTARRATFAQCFKMHDQLFLGMTGLQSDVDTLCAPSPTGGLARASTCLCGARLASSPRAARRARAHRLQQRVRLPLGSPHVCVCLPGCRYERFRFKLNLVRAADALRLHGWETERLPQHLNLPSAPQFELKEERQMKPETFANVVAHTLYEKRCAARSVATCPRGGARARPFGFCPAARPAQKSPPDNTQVWTVLRGALHCWA